jgi:hypothetical protein
VEGTGNFWGGFARVLEGRAQEVAAAWRGRQENMWRVGRVVLLSFPRFLGCYLFLTFLLDKTFPF